MKRNRRWQSDLQNILSRGLAKDPSRRYPSASALNADIENLLSGNPVEASGDSLPYRLEKLARKYRYRFAALSVAAASMLVLAIGLAVLTMVANQARDDAQRRLAQSEALIQFLLGDLRTQLEPSVSLQVLDTMGEKAMAYFLSLEAADQSDESLAQMALSLRQIGDIRLAQGRFSEGQAAFHRSMELTSWLYERNPLNDQRLFDLGQSYYWLGFAEYRRGNFEAAREPFIRYLELSEALVARDPERLESLLELSYAYNNLGTLDHETGQLASARAKFSRSLELKQQLLQLQPDHRDWQNELADTLAWLADTEEALGALDQALAYQQQRWHLANTLASKHPNHRQLQQSLGYASLALARQQMVLGQSGRAQGLMEQAIELADKRMVADPENLHWLEDATRARLDLARLLILEGRQTAADHWVTEAQQMAEHMVSLPEAEPGWAIQLHARAAYLKLMGTTHALEYEPANARLNALQAKLDSLTATYPDDSFLSQLRARVDILDGDFSARHCQHSRAGQLWRNALNSSYGSSPRHPDWIAIEAIVLTRLQYHTAATKRIRQLAAMGYGEPWYMQALTGGNRPSACPGQTVENSLSHRAEPD